jgi:hydroxyacylglutathione hydrolase
VNLRLTGQPGPGLAGMPALSRLTGAAYHVSAADTVSFGRVAVGDGDVIEISPVMSVRALAAVRHHRPVVVVDVRSNSEWGAGHIDGAVHVPLPDLPGRIGELPAGELWVHCQGGYRAAVAASILDAAGRPVVVVDDDFDRAVKEGLPVTGVDH